MIETIQLAPGVTLRCCCDSRFKQGRLSLQLIRPMCREEAAMNALLPTVLLRGSKNYPDLRAITVKLDDLYGATVGDLVRRIGDHQTTGFYCSFTEDRFALDGDRIFAPTVDFLRELLLEPASGGEGFVEEYVRSERKNLISDIEAQKNDKSAYAAGQLLKHMCHGDSFSIPRIGEKEQAERITAEGLYRHYRKVLRESPVALFYVGSAGAEEVAEVLRPIFAGMERDCRALPEQTPFRDCGGSHIREEMDIAQSRLCVGFTTPVTNKSSDFAAMQVFNAVFGAGMTSKLFTVIREKMSLCYSIGSGFYGSKGILTVSAGIDADKEMVVREEILNQLDECRRGNITEAELTAAREAVLSGLRSVMDSPGTIEGYFSTAALSGLCMELEEYCRTVEAVTVADAARAAQTLTLHSSYFLKGAAK